MNPMFPDWENADLLLPFVLDHCTLQQGCSADHGYSVLAVEIDSYGKAILTPTQWGRIRQLLGPAWNRLLKEFAGLGFTPERCQTAKKRALCATPECPLRVSLKAQIEQWETATGQTVYGIFARELGCLRTERRINEWGLVD